MKFKTVSDPKYLPSTKACSEIDEYLSGCGKTNKASTFPKKGQTYIGRIKQSGFDFLGYRITLQTKDKVSLAWKTIANHIDELQQLYEQGANEQRIAEYVKHWLQWVRSGVEIDLRKVIDQSLNSDLGKKVMGYFGLERVYREVLG